MSVANLAKRMFLYNLTTPSKYTFTYLYVFLFGAHFSRSSMDG